MHLTEESPDVFESVPGTEAENEKDDDSLADDEETVDEDQDLIHSGVRVRASLGERTPGTQGKTCYKSVIFETSNPLRHKISGGSK